MAARHTFTLTTMAMVGAAALYAVLFAPSAVAGVLLETGFTTASSHWIPYAPGGGSVVYADGVVRATIPGSSPSCCYTDAEINDVMGYNPLPWRFVNVDVRLRASDGNGYGGSSGVGSRGWGFWTGSFGALGGGSGHANFLWFLSLSPESDPPFPGFWANVVRDDVIGLQADVGIDMTGWHDYRIVWRPNDASFYVDGDFIGSDPNPPQVPMGLVFWIDNYRVFFNGSFFDRDYLAVPEDQWIELDRLRVFTSRVLVHDGAGRRKHTIAAGEPLLVVVDDPDENLSRSLPEQVAVTVTDASNGDTETIACDEEGADAGRFACMPLPTASGPAVAGNGTLETKAGDTVHVAYQDADDAGDTAETTVLATSERVDLVPGRGSTTSDCSIEAMVENPANPLDRKGLPNVKQVCRQGDPTCDFSPDPTVCRFHVGACLNEEDPVFDRCKPLDVETVEVRKPRPDSHRPEEAALGQDLISLLSMLGNASVGGRHQNTVTFAPAVESNRCTDLVDVDVPLRGSNATRPGKRAFRIIATSSTGRRDRDRLILKCLP